LPLAFFLKYWIDGIPIDASFWKVLLGWVVLQLVTSALTHSKCRCWRCMPWACGRRAGDATDTQQAESKHADDAMGFWSQVHLCGSGTFFGPGQSVCDVDDCGATKQGQNGYWRGSFQSDSRAPEAAEVPLPQRLIPSAMEGGPEAFAGRNLLHHKPVPNYAGLPIDAAMLHERGISCQRTAEMQPPADLSGFQCGHDMLWMPAEPETVRSTTAEACHRNASETLHAEKVEEKTAAATAETQEQLRKTKLCIFYAKNRCLRGDSCNYAHSSAELQDTPDLSKTKLCYNFRRHQCRDTKCKYAHGVSELRPLPGRMANTTPSAGIQ